MQNAFLTSVRKEDTTTENGAVSHSFTGSELADQFSKSGSHRDRNISEVFAEQSKLQAQVGIWALRFIFYLRMITRVISFFDGSKSKEVQKGQGNRDESFKRFLWYAQNMPEVFYTNLQLFTSVGSVKDIFELLWYAKQYKIEIDERKVLTIALADDENMLLLKYLPLSKSSKKAISERAKYRNHIARLIEEILDATPEQLRKTKSSGTAHTWQQLISQKKFDLINFNLISGKALLNLVSGKFLANQNLTEKYNKWILSKPVAKFTGYVYELGMKVTHNMSLPLKHTVDKQFEGLVQLNKTTSKRKMICAIDRSGSMTHGVANTSAMNIAESLGIYFSSMLEGPFKDWVIRFSRRSEWVKLSGTFSEKKLQMTWGDCPTNTDFQSVIDSIINVRRKFPNVPESDFPDTVLVVSDMQFDNAGPKTNYQVAIQKLSQVFSEGYTSKFTFIWWDCTGRVKTNTPQSIDEPNGYVLSGFDGSVISLILGQLDKADATSEKVTIEQSIEDILSQEALMKVSL